MQILRDIQKVRQQRSTSLAVLIDPESTGPQQLSRLVRLATEAQVDYFFVGGSTVDHSDMVMVLEILEHQQIPVIIFPGNTNQLSNKADGLLFLSLISGRNPDLLIGKHVESVPFLRSSELELMPTGYILIDGGNKSSVAYISNTTPIPHNSIDLTIATALAGQYLGLQLIYLEAGSGAKHCVSTEMIAAVKKEISIPLIVGGGIRTPEKAKAIAEAGADVIVIGNILEKEVELIMDLSIAVHSSKTRIV